MKTLDWYFDFVSPYAYLQNAVIDDVVASSDGIVIRRRPLLFAGLLGHWGNVGPAEIVPKREWTFRHCTWLAARHGVPLTMPTMHPFNPLPLLRLSIALGDTRDVVDRLFAYVWIDGRLPTDREHWLALLAELAVDEAALQAPEVKDALRSNGADALAAGVFGVPTAVVDGQRFWGFDATAMLDDYLRGDPLFDGDAMRAAREMPVGPGRSLAARAAA